MCPRIMPVSWKRCEQCDIKFHSPKKKKRANFFEKKRVSSYVKRGPDAPPIVRPRRNWVRPIFIGGPYEIVELRVPPQPCPSCSRPFIPTPKSPSICMMCYRVGLEA